MPSATPTPPALLRTAFGMALAGARLVAAIATSRRNGIARQAIRFYLNPVPDGRLSHPRGTS